MKVRSLKNQLNFVVSSSFTPGQSKHSLKKQGQETVSKIFSNKTCSKMRSLSNSLADFMKSNYPEVRMVRDIKPDHIKAYIKEKETGWKSEKSRTEKYSQLRKLNTMAQEVYGHKVNFTDGLKKSTLFSEKGLPKIRDITMSEADFKCLNDKLMTSRSRGRYIPSITYHIGTRLEEAVCLKVTDIDLKAQVIHLKHCKGGRNRDIYIGDRPEAVKFFTELLNMAKSNGWKTLGGDLKVQSVSRMINRTLKSLYEEGRISTDYASKKCGNHSIRKLFAQKELARQFKVELKDLKTVPIARQRAVWPQVQEMLGHGFSHREDLFKVYILSK